MQEGGIEAITKLTDSQCRDRISTPRHLSMDDKARLLAAHCQQYLNQRQDQSNNSQRHHHTSRAKRGRRAINFSHTELRRLAEVVELVADSDY